MDINYVYQAICVLLVSVPTYLLLIRPQVLRLKHHRNFLCLLKIGDVVVTNGGLIGEIVGLDDPLVVNVELSEHSRVRILRRNVESLFGH